MAAAITAMAALWSQAIQQPAAFVQLDASHYYALAADLASGRTPVAEVPFAYRIGMPWLVAQIRPHDVEGGFRLLNIACSLVLPILLWAWLRTAVDRPVVRLGLVALYVAAWHGPVRYVYYNAGYVDPAFMVCVLIGLLAIHAAAARRSAAALAALTAITVVGVPMRETMMMVPLGALWLRPLGQRSGNGLAAWLPSWWPALIPIACGAASLVLTHMGVSTIGSRSFGSAATQWLRKPPSAYLLAWFTTFGPVLAIVLFDWRQAGRDLAARPYLAVYLALCAALGFVGGADTERFLFWAMPAMYVLIGRAVVRRFDVMRAPHVWVGLAAAQAVSARIFWAIPDTRFDPEALGHSAGLWERLYAFLDRLFVIEHFHWNLWSSFGSPSFRLMRLGVYLSVTALLMWAMSRRARQVSAA